MLVFLLILNGCFNVDNKAREIKESVDEASSTEEAVFVNENEAGKEKIETPEDLDNRYLNSPFCFKPINQEGSESSLNSSEDVLLGTEDDSSDDSDLLREKDKAKGCMALSDEVEKNVNEGDDSEIKALVAGVKENISEVSKSKKGKMSADLSSSPEDN